MKWIEQIRVRSSSDALETSLPSLRITLDEIEAANQGAETFSMQHALYEGDLAVVIVWSTGTPRKTREALLIAQQLERVGSVDHAVWHPTK